MRNAIIVPICISPAPMRFPPNQIAATLDTFSTSMTLGNMNAMSRPARSDELVSDWLATSKRAPSSGSRTKARTTRMPVICSRMTWLTRSMRFCMCWNSGTSRTTTIPTQSEQDGDRGDQDQRKRARPGGPP